MKTFNVGDAVFAEVEGFTPFPALVENVLLNEADSAVFYYVRLFGATEIVPMDAEKLKPIQGNKHKYKMNYSGTEMAEESKMRVDALLGAEDDVPDVLMNFVTVDSDFEEVSPEDVRRLGLCSVVLSPSMVNKLNQSEASETDKSDGSVEENDDFVDVEAVQQDNQSKVLLSENLKSSIFHPCKTCPKTFRTKRALRTHQKRSLLCSNARFRQTIRTESLKTKTLREQPRSLLKKRRTKSSDADLEGKIDELFNKDKSKWANRSANGYYPCKLCFRKFRSIGEVSFHMASHQTRQSAQREIGRSQKVKEVSSSESDGDGSMSNDENQGRSSTRHSSMERERRAELASKFAELAEAALLERNASKVKILQCARLRIKALETESEEQVKQIDTLEDTNLRLRARYLELNPAG